VTGESEGLGRGSRFTVRLPLLGTPDRDTARERQGVSAAADVRPRRMLVVDDNPDVAESLSEWLGDGGHDVRVARTGAAALQEAEAFRPEVLFIDVGLPDMSGHDVARKLRQLPALKDAVLVAVTGYGQQSDRRRSREAGFDHHWIKPLTGEMLADLLASLDARDRKRRPT
jgi:CheY-like chemotaxis protein